LLAINSRDVVRVARDIIACWRGIWIDIDNVPIVYLKTCRVNHFDRLIYLRASVLKDHRNRVVNEPRPDNDLTSARLTLDALAINLLLTDANDDIFGSAPKCEKRTSFSFKVGRGCGYVLHTLWAAEIIR
jgi:hypothetical protein